ncbi:D-xylulose kinase [Desulfosporosinus orientis DSM 765]|uniref:Xylulose kinase n=1 Tax=Desulfosporosinus orientis (strain ATCC 19365 / DSM 765 / NCIMB 8382 / VKM B-1628 / Singapore I) TaxID=768706 RepID=G7WFH5_DESOD|nr:xylulokinase [Desulfosporosinus orientis]AET68418.1 D-xylulose kinase [Desulfosporosinus orientis DSM 765]
MQYLLGVDLGTSGTKTVLFDLAGNPICAKTIEYPLYQPANGWAEQDPSDWWNATCDGIKYVITASGIDASEIAGIGLSGQMHGLVMLDRDGIVLRKSIIWCDQRTADECQQMNELVGERRLIEITANPALTGFTASKILWVQNHEPELYEKCAHILLPKDYIRYMLTGEFATEMSDASGMQLMDIPQRRWSDEILSKFNITKSMLGKLYESPDITGQVHQRAAELTGLREGTIVVGGAADNSAAAVGTGVVRSGNAFTTIGTSGVIYAISNDVSIDIQGRVHTFCSAVPGKWTVMSCTLGAGLSLKWLRDTCCLEEIKEAENLGVDPYVVMNTLAEQVKPGAGGLVYLPYLMGERSPHPDPYCRGVFFGLSASHNRGNMIRAVMEGVAYSQRECVDVFKEMQVNVQDMIACGGGGRSPLWRQMLADMYNCPVSTIKADEGPAFGAAILAGVGAGVYTSVEDACDNLVIKNSIQHPNPAAQKTYEEYYQLYKKLYVDLQESFKYLSRLPK